eukprot:CAMPEP_0204196282 /NCGR_PEP_ID=MMETSP0361-20130328/63715_1 /ASSEMBLY_ACC=CAM_ASM_000343 /TAXON_ID=268821 /ORGANISM="Scrippsiella Hangoei, Strain SHTV-5" /LENGTH=77 /DNA_ID=CAMNT_0051158005 /DNA_START=128 /DNA_END=357 /DNA_ORIENTATION=-
MKPPKDPGIPSLSHTAPRAAGSESASFPPRATSGTCIARLCEPAPPSSHALAMTDPNAPNPAAEGSTAGATPTARAA